MPRGVTDRFLRILTTERQLAVRTMGAMLGLAAVAYFMAELTDAPLLGAVVWTALASLVVGLVVGAVHAWWTTRRYGESLRLSWNQWMRMSLASDRMRDVARKVEDRSPRPPLAGIGWTALFMGNALLFWALWTDQPWASAFGAGVTVANGLTAGAMMGRAGWNLQWAARFSKSLREMLGSGEIGLWGET